MRAAFYKSGCVILVFILVCCAFDTPKFLSEALDSDLLLPASLFWDISHRGWAAAISAFQLPRIPSVLPDLALFGAAQLLTGSWRAAYMAYAIGALTLTAFLAARIADRVSGKTKTNGMIAFLAVAAPVLIAELLTGKIEASVHLWLLKPVSHGGCFILSLAGFLLLQNWMDRPDRKRLAILFLLTFLGVFSDKLLLVFFCFPGLAVTLLLGRRWGLSIRAIIEVICVFAVATVLAMLCDRWLVVRQPDLPFLIYTFAAWSSHALRLLGSLFRIIAPEAPLAFVLGAVLPLLCFFAQVPRALWRGGRDPAQFWWLASLFSMGATLLACSTLYIRLSQYRYLGPLLWWPILWAMIALRSERVRRFRLAEAGAGASFAILALHFFSSGIHRPALLTWRDPLASCLLDLKNQGRLSAGVTEFWFARYLEVVSDWRLQIASVTAQGALTYWGNDPYWSVHDLEDAARAPRYDFLVAPPHADPDVIATVKKMVGSDAAHSWREENAGFGMDFAALESTYGTPEEKLQCPGSTGLSRFRGATVEIWRYGPNNTLLDVLKRAPYFSVANGAPSADKTLFLAPETFAAKAQLVEPGALRTRLAEGGVAIYGPSSWGTNVDLPEGRYSLSLRYSLPGALPATLLLTANNGRKTLKTISLPATGQSDANLPFDLELKSPEKHLDIIVTLPPDGDMTLRGLMIGSTAS